jgi:protein-disulfide isomerase
MENEVTDNTGKSQEISTPIEDRPLTKREKRELAKLEKQTERLKNEKTKKLQKWVVGLLVIALVGFGIYKLRQWINTPQTGTNSSEILSVKSDDWEKGNPNAKVALIEYADFECPACKIYSSEVLPKLSNDFRDDLKVVYRHFPLPQHTKAVDAAKAVEAAGRQGKFWEMYNLLYKKQNEWSEGNFKEKLLSYAESLGVNKEQYEKDFESDETMQSIKTDEADGYSLRINETPTFYVNGKKVNLENNGYEDLKKAIEKALVTGNR